MPGTLLHFSVLCDYSRISRKSAMNTFRNLPYTVITHARNITNRCHIYACYMTSKTWFSRRETEVQVQTTYADSVLHLSHYRCEKGPLMRSTQLHSLQMLVALMLLVKTKVESLTCYYSEYRRVSPLEQCLT